MKGILSLSLGLSPPLIDLSLLDPAVQLIKSSFFITVVDLEGGEGREEGLGVGDKRRKKHTPNIPPLPGAFFIFIPRFALSCFVLFFPPQQTGSASAAPNRPVFPAAARRVISDPCYSIMGGVNLGSLMTFSP